MSPVSGLQGSMWQTQPPPSVRSAVKTIPDGSVRDDIPRVRDPEVASSGQIKAIPSLAPPTTDTPQELGESIPPMIPSKPQPKRARRAELSEELIARDLDWFKSNQGITAVNEGPGPSSSMASESSQARASDTSHVSRLPPLLLKKKTARMVPSRSFPRRIPLDATQEVESGVSASALPPSELSGEKVGPSDSAEEVSVQMDVDEQKPSPGIVNPDARSTAIPEAHDVQEVSRLEELPSAELRLVPTSSNEPTTGPKILQIDGQSPLVEAPLLNSESRISTPPPPPPPETTLDGMDISDLGSEILSSEPPDKSEPTPPPSPQMLQLRNPILPPLVNALQPPLNLNFRVPQMLLGQPQRWEMDVIQRRFDNEMTVIHSTQGKPLTYTHMIDISLNESSFSKISKWVNRKFDPSYVAGCPGVEQT